MKIELVDDWRESWRWFSVQVIAFYGTIGATAIAAWPVVQWTIDMYMPTNVIGRLCVSLLALVVFVVLPILARLASQGASDAANHEDGE